ncbi:DUF2254 domain-containing protein [Maricaulis sp.]|uniref:DUF2254 domain-containing protein n=1 Tax=Maricaulis sp. TaxID=1486257 RepID=UPI002B267176|nr:DUF2254 domain-containing protein [Maricaulis sp.]
MSTRIFHLVLELRERLWAKPLLYCFLAVIASFVARGADAGPVGALMPEISPDTIQTLLTIISSSMLAVATFAVASMLSSYASASTSATPRAFKLILADDVSQTALSSFIGAFIFSIISIVALKTGFYERGGLFALFILTLSIFAWVVLTFVRWVDNIARLGRLGTTIDTVEDAALESLRDRRACPCLGGIEKTDNNALDGDKVHDDRIGYVQHVDMHALQRLAEQNDLRMMLDSPPGCFLAPGRTLVTLDQSDPVDEEIRACIAKAFVIADNRTFKDDPRFGLIVLSEIAARALSPSVNDPGTAIVIIGRFVRLFAAWSEPLDDDAKPEIQHDRIIVAPLDLAEMFDDAFTAIARDGAGMVEVGIRLQKCFVALASRPAPGFRDQARRHSALALQRARTCLDLADDIDSLERIRKTLPPAAP